MGDVEVSIVIPTYNRVESLIETLESLFNQTYSHDKYEIIVCDDNSKDDTEIIVAKLIENTDVILRYFKIQSTLSGPAKVRNEGVVKSQGKIIGFTDDDCIVPSDWIESAMQVFSENRDASGVYGSIITPGTCKKTSLKIPRKVSVFKDDGSCCTGNIFYKKEVLLDVGLFDTEQRYLEDIELSWKVRKVGRIVFNKESTVMHKLRCLSILEHLKSLNHIEYWPVMYAKHPEYVIEDGLLFNHIKNIRVLYVIFAITGICSMFISNLLGYIFLSLSIIIYFHSRVLTDKNIKKYLMRILMLPLYLILDSIRLFYSVKGSIRSRYLVLY